MVCTKSITPEKNPVGGPWYGAIDESVLRTAWKPRVVFIGAYRRIRGTEQTQGRSSGFSMQFFSFLI